MPRDVEPRDLLLELQLFVKDVVVGLRDVGARLVGGVVRRGVEERELPATALQPLGALHELGQDLDEAPPVRQDLVEGPRLHQVLYRRPVEDVQVDAPDEIPQGFELTLLASRDDRVDRAMPYPRHRAQAEPDQVVHRREALHRGVDVRRKH